MCIRDSYYTDGDSNIDTVHFYYENTEQDSLIYNPDKQLIKRIHPENAYSQKTTLYTYDSLGREIQTFAYDSVFTGFPSIALFLCRKLQSQRQN